MLPLDRRALHVGWTVIALATLTLARPARAQLRPPSAGVVQPYRAPILRDGAPYVVQTRPGGAGPAWRGMHRCGPTTLYMAGRSLGLFPHPASDARAIQRLDRVDGMIDHGTTPRAMVETAQRFGMTTDLRTGWRPAFVDRALGDGKAVVLSGDARYLPGRDPNAPNRMGHYILVVGKLADGRFVVHDPGPNAGGKPTYLTQAQLRRFANGMPSPTALALGVAPDT